MKYWVFIQEKVDGPYDENSLVTLQGFTPDTLICSEEAASQGKQEWVKASSVFEFDEVPAEEPQPAPQPQSEPAQAAVPANDVSILLDKLNAISNEMLYLQTRLDQMQQRLDDSAKSSQQTPQPSVQQAQPDGLAPQTQTPAHTQADAQPTSYPVQEPPEAEEEVVIRSALDSMYAGKIADSLQEDAVQDLLPQKTAERQAAAQKAEEQAVQAIGQELEFIPVSEEEQATPQQDEATVPQALITTPSADEAAKDALLNELAGSPKEDVLDQIIQEHQAAQSAPADLDLPLTPVEADPAQNPTDTTPVELEATPAQTPAIDLSDIGTQDPKPVVDEPQVQAAQPEPLPLEVSDEQPQQDSSAALALGALAVGGAALAAAHTSQNAPAQADAPADTLEIAPDKNQPDLLEPVLPAQEMPADVPPAEEPAPLQAEPADLPAVEQTVPAQTDAAPAEEPAPVADLPALEDAGQAQAQPTPDPVQEPVVPEASVSEEKSEMVEELVPAKQPEPTPTEQKEGGLTDKDLEDAFGPSFQEPQAQPSADNVSSPAEEPAPQPAVDQLQTVTANAAEETITHASNPNDLTEIELKEGSTYLISDFVPPAQFTDNVADVMGDEQNQQPDNKKEATAFQDMLAATITSQSTQPISADGLPSDVAATQVNLENTIQAKRGATLDIKTVPMVSEPGQTDRLDVNELTDVNAQHDVKHAGTSRATKLVVGGLVSLLVLIIAYVLLGLMHLLPQKINAFGGQKAAVAQPAQELLEEQPASQPQQPSPADQALSRVQNFPLPNGLTLKAFIESKHSFAEPEMITWTVADAVEPDNYSVTVRVPPENPQSFQTAYRFNYSTVTGLLEPTISDAKNLLDQAYGMQAPAPQPDVQQQPAPVSAQPAKQTAGTKARTGAARKTTAKRTR